MSQGTILQNLKVFCHVPHCIKKEKYTVKTGGFSLLFPIPKKKDSVKDYLFFCTNKGNPLLFSHINNEKERGGISMGKCNPVIKWAGGKRQLIDEIIPRIPKSYNNYYEPFFGGGAIYFYIQPEHAIVNDANPVLINMYRQLRDHPDEVMKMLDAYQEHYNDLTPEEQKEYYYQLRDDFNQYITEKQYDIQLAALFIFINKACFNGIYRENSKGLFNVPSGRKKKINAYSAKNIEEVSAALQHAKVYQGDYYDTAIKAEAGDFVFFDPPYYDTFSDYQKNGFPEEEHRRLADLFKALTERGVYCMLTNSNTDFVKELYKDYYVEIVSVKRMINRNADGRTGEEVLITNYPIQKEYQQLTLDAFF